MVSEMGHRVTGVARTHAEAVKLAASERPELILADIQQAAECSPAAFAPRVSESCAPISAHSWLHSITESVEAQ